MRLIIRLFAAITPKRAQVWLMEKLVRYCIWAVGLAKTQAAMREIEQSIVATLPAEKTDLARQAFRSLFSAEVRYRVWGPPCAR